MQENTKSEKPEDSLGEEEHLPDAEEMPENSTESDPEFEEQKFLPSEEKKKSWAGKVLLLLILVLTGSGGYLYFNNLIPAEVSNFVFQKPAPSKPLALVTPTPPFMGEMDVEIPEPAEVPEPVITKPAAISPLGIQETRPSGTPSTSPVRLPGNDFDRTPEEEDVAKEPQETASLGEPDPTMEQKVAEEVVAEVIAPPEPSSEEDVAKEPQETTSLEEPDPTMEQKVAEEVVAEVIVPPEPSSLLEPDELQRTEAVQAYLDFIESSVQKFGQLIKEGFDWSWDYLKQKLS